jgi:hypothetical protein
VLLWALLIHTANRLLYDFNQFVETGFNTTINIGGIAWLSGVPTGGVCSGLV